MLKRDMAAESGAMNGFVVVALIAVLAYSGLWVSERIADARTSEPGQACARAAGRVGSTPWERAREAAPTGDPRRLLARGSTSTRKAGAQGPKETDASNCTALPSPFLAVGAAP